MKYIILVSLLIVGTFASECHPKYDCCKGCHTILTDEEGNWGVENKQWCFINNEKCSNEKDNEINKYPVCNGCKVYYTDKNGNWGVENKQWCFIDNKKCSDEEDNEISKYPVCNGCKVYYTDKKGNWGVENKQWCFIDNDKCKLVDENQNNTPTEPHNEEPGKEDENKNDKPEDHKNIVPIIYITSKTGTNNFVDDPITNHVSNITHYGMEKPPYPYYEECTFTVEDENGEKVMENVKGKAKARGNWTTLYVKKSIRINFDKKQSMLGLNNNAKFKNWLLLAEYKDNSLLRSKTSFELSRDILAEDNLYVSDSKYVEVVINGEYYGVYLLVEVQQINKGRVDITKAKDGYTGTDIGYLLEYDTVYAQYEDKLQSINMRYHNNDFIIPYDGLDGYSWEDYFNFGMEEIEAKAATDPNFEFINVASSQEYIDNVLNMSIKSDIYNQEQHDFITNYINNVYNIIYEAAYNKHTLKFNEDYTDIVDAPEFTPREAIENVIDINSLVDMYIISELTCDADLYFSSFYMDVDFGKDGSKKLRFEAPWDFDSGLGNRKSCLNGSGFFAGNINEDQNVPGKYQINPWLAITMYEDWYQDLIKAKWTKLYDNGVFSHTVENIHSNLQKYNEVFKRDYAKWDNEVRREAIGTELAHQEMESRSAAESAAYLAEWMEARVDFMNNHWHQ
ncbi:hypothetical protein BCR32DRAFT_303413 [Anaeromyces robustus]|uniref:CBM10 domain-containing protein n=1 Tax=Anaeromyces robustus TaxID=1754192 RepID=A0A1Y1WST8_9FUNG|nr:hypothetical protein BCR32DRAFT_303413 [Anaeromyces robustus]|eukprot:ORX76597.1 hypothetical protein BCR32DRAFT_303413 [Anaeromyces robustus]